MPAKRQRLLAPKFKTLLSLLPESQRRIARDNRKKQLFESMVCKLVQGRPLPEEELRRIVRKCASRILDEDLAGKAGARARLKERLTKILRKNNKLPGWHLLSEDAKRALRFFSPKQPLLFASGARCFAELTIGCALYDFPVDPGIRIFVKPDPSEFDNPALIELKRKLFTFRRGDYSHIESMLAGSIGYFGIGVHKVKGERKPTVVIWVRQQRVIPEFPTAIRKRYEMWDVELLRYVEVKLKEAGVKRLAVVSPAYYLRHKETIRREYEIFEKRLKALGYAPKNLKLLGLAYYYSHGPFLVKILK
jgi:hypothetical protein